MAEQPDFSGRYNTPLSPADASRYQDWLRALSASRGRDASGDSFDYDMQGAFLAGAEPSGNGHFPDTFKKPNHPTFSDQSQYNGVDGYQGGSWVPQPGDKWAYQASPTNVQMHGADNLQAYFKQVEPSNTLLLPPAPAQGPPGILTTPPGALTTPPGALSGGVW